MIELSAVNEMVRQAFAPFLRKVGLRRVFSEPTVGSLGEAALRVVIVVDGDRAVDIDGDDALDAMVSAGRKLDEAGEERQPIFTFATENELQDVDDSEF